MLDQLGWRTLEQRQVDARIYVSFIKLSVGLWQYLSQITYNPHTECPGTATQWLFAKSKQLGIIISIHSFH